MSIELKIEAAPGRFASGAALPVKVTLKNTGNEVLQAPEAMFQDVFEYSLQALDPKGSSYGLSAQRARLARIDDHLPTQAITTSPLPAGQSRVFNSDLASLSSQALAPGRYLLTAAYAGTAGRVTSPATPIELLAPAWRALASVSATRGARLAQVAMDIAADGSGTLYQRESQDERPEDGVLYARWSTKAPVQMLGAATAADSDTSPDGVRWFAWLQNGPGGVAVGAGVAQGETVFKRVDALPLGVAKAVLAPNGWQGSQESASFAALAQGTDGGLKLVMVAFSASGQSGVRSVALDGAAAPSRWLLRFHGPGAPLKLDLVTVEAQAGRVRVVHRLVDMARGAASAPLTLNEGPEPVAALSLEPLRGRGPDAVDVLFAAAGAPPRMVFKRLPLSGGKPLEETAFGVPADAQGQVPGDWQLAPPAHPQRVAAAKFGQQLIGRHLSQGGKGFVLDPQAQGASQLQLRSAGPALWATWADAALGLRFAKVP